MNLPEPHPDRPEMDALDRAIAGALRSLQPPGELLARILAEERALREAPVRVVPGPWFTSARFWLAAAAVLFVALSFYLGQPVRGEFDQFSGWVARVEAPEVIAGRANLSLMSDEMGSLEAYLRAVNAPSVSGGFQPSDGFKPVGCKTIKWRGMTCSLVCFYDSQGRGAHLFIARAGDFHTRPGGTPRFAMVGNLETASWSRGSNSFVLVGAPGVNVREAMRLSESPTNS